MGNIGLKKYRGKMTEKKVLTEKDEYFAAAAAAVEGEAEQDLVEEIDAVETICQQRLDSLSLVDLDKMALHYANVYKCGYVYAKKRIDSDGAATYEYFNNCCSKSPACTDTSSLESDYNKTSANEGSASDENLLTG